MFLKIKQIIKILVYIFLFIIFTLFVFNNGNFVKFSLFPFAYEIEIRLFLLVILSFVFGILFSGFLNIVNDSFGIKTLRQRIKLNKMQKEIEKLKSDSKKV